jgi:CubicO group peptidase (beta-lactamase class C family)
VAHFLPGFQARTVTIRHLLTHSSGLDLRLSALRDEGAAGIRAAVYMTMPCHQPGTVMAYTNSNSLILGDVIAAVMAQPLDQAMQDLLLAPLALRETGYCPPPECWPRIPPTEYDDHWRNGLVWGQVHDESAYALGGVAGHAGLFASAADLERFALLWLHGGEALLRPATVALALRDHSVALRSSGTGPALRGGLGWMLDRSFMGSAPPGSAGHTGFTGPVLIILPARQISIVILSNRTYPYRRPPPYPHHRVTAAIVDAVLA